MTVANVQQHYYRFKRKAQTQTKTSARKANSSARGTVSKVQDRAVNAAVTAAGRIPAKQRKQLGKGIGTAAKGAGAAQAVGKEVRDDITQVMDDVFTAFGELLTEARKNPRFRTLEKRVVSRFMG